MESLNTITFYFLERAAKPIFLARGKHRIHGLAKREYNDYKVKFFSCIGTFDSSFEEILFRVRSGDDTWFL